MPDTVNSLLDELLSALPPDSQLRQQADIRLDEVAKKRLEKLPFESLWERVARVTGDEFVACVLQTACGCGAPNFHHKAIAWLLEQGYVQSLFTTNYDAFVELALYPDGSASQNYRQFADHDNMIVKFVPPDSEPQHQFRFVKLHGTLSVAKTLAFKFPQITTGFRRETDDRLRELLTPVPTLFAGYGCNDWDLRHLLRAPLDAVWVTHLDNWNGVDDRCRCLSEFHKSTAWFRSDLRSGNPSDSVFVQLARQFGCGESWETVVDTTHTRTYPIVKDLDRAKKLAILAELLDSLALLVARDIFKEAQDGAESRRDKVRYEIASYVAASHDMVITPERQLDEGEKLVRRQDYERVDRIAVLCQLAFTHLIGGNKRRGLQATLGLIWGVRHLRREAESRNLRQRGPMEWSSDDRHVASTLAKAREVFAHNIIRIAWFHYPGRAGWVIRIIRALGVRRLLAMWAHRVLSANRTGVVTIGELFSIGNLERESAHASCLTGRLDDALARAEIAEEALQWGRWYQWEANALRTRGWVWLHIGGRVRRLRRYADREAKRCFLRAVALANDFVGPQGEMVDDRMKALLELKRLAALEGAPFDQAAQLEADLASIAQTKPNNHRRYSAIATFPPRSREPLG